jgi:hypothetical protein
VSAKPSPGAAEGYLLAFEEGVRGLTRQEAQLDGMRSRAGILLSAAAIATSFLGGRALSDHGPEVWTWLAIAGFMGLAVGARVILWPRRDWAFSARPGLIVSPHAGADLRTHRPEGLASALELRRSRRRAADQQPRRARAPQRRHLPQAQPRQPIRNRRATHRTMLSAHTTCRLQRRSLHAYLIDLLGARARGGPAPLLA